MLPIFKILTETVAPTLLKTVVPIKVCSLIVNYI